MEQYQFMPTRLAFDEGLGCLERELQALGATVVEAVGLAVHAAVTGDAALAQQVHQGDREVNEGLARVHRQAVVLLATQQPTARDLRVILAALISAIDLERVGDHAKGIARNHLEGGDPLPDMAREGLLELSALVQDMLRLALAALANRDVQAARALAERDTTVDNRFQVLRARLLQAMATEPQRASHLDAAEWCGKSLERVGDHATNIGEQIVFLCTGEVVELNG